MDIFKKRIEKIGKIRKEKKKLKMKCKYNGL